MKKEDFISVRLFGGLGNQIFQYMAGKWLATERKIQLYVDTNWLRDGYTHTASNVSEFEFYRPDYEYGNGHYNQTHLYFDRLATVAARNIPFMGKITKINAPKNAGFEDLSSIRSGYQLRGYYQSPLYFKSLMEFGEFSNSSFELNRPSKYFKSAMNDIPNDGYLAVHVRGGDFLQKNSPYLQLGSDYYRKAIKSLIEICGNLPVWVFSDDLNQAKEVLSNSTDLIFFEPEGLTAAETMKIMSNAKGIVCANSTFSYWAGLISGNQSVTIAPKQWMKSFEQPEAFFPENWFVI